MAEAATFNAQASLLLLLRQAGVLVGLAAAVALGLYVALWARQPEYSVLFADLQDRDMNQVIEALNSNKIPYRMDPGGGTVLVAAEQLADARMKLAGAGLPRGGAGGGFESMSDEQPFGTSQFLEQARYQHAIEGELSRSISHITNVRSARVHIALPKQSAFARSKRDPSASVIVDLYNGRQLERHQVAAIAQMVSASVAGMPVSQVTVIDQRGNLLTDNSEAGDALAVSAKRFEYSRTLKQSYIDRVEAILTPLVGADGVRAQVTADLDFTESQRSQESFNPDSPSVRSESSTEEERSGDAASGIPGALSNQPAAAANAPEQTANAEGQPPGAAGAEKSATAAVNKRSQNTKNYELDHRVVVEKNHVGSIRRLSVAVVVRAPPIPVAPVGAEAAAKDKKPAADEEAAAAPETAAATTATLSEAEITRMTNLVKEAIGFDAARGDSVSITSAQFLVPPLPEALPEPPIWQQPWVWNVAKQVAGGLFALFVLFGVIRPTVKSLISKPVTLTASGERIEAGALDANGLPALAGPAAMDGQMALTNQRADGNPLLASSEIDPNIDSVKQFVSNDPRVAAQVIKGWVGGE